MARPAKIDNPGGISDAAVKKATGKTWAQWLKILDAAGARKMKHKDIAIWLNKNHPEAGPWWGQMVTVGYEQARGLRQKHEKPDGFSISGSKTIAASAQKAFAAWQDARQRRRWLPDGDIHIRRATLHKAMRITWSDRETSVLVNFYPKGNTKCQVTVEHNRLPNAKAAERMKAFWAERLAALRSMLED